MPTCFFTKKYKDVTRKNKNNPSQGNKLTCFREKADAAFVMTERIKNNSKSSSELLKKKWNSKMTLQGNLLWINGLKLLRPEVKLFAELEA